MSDLDALKESVIKKALEFEEKHTRWQNLPRRRAVNSSESGLAHIADGERLQARHQLILAVQAFRDIQGLTVSKLPIVTIPMANVLSALRPIQGIQCVWRSPDRERYWIQVSTLSCEFKITDHLKQSIEVMRQQAPPETIDLRFYFYIVPPSKVVTIPTDSELCWTAETL